MRNRFAGFAAVAMLMLVFLLVRTPAAFPMERYEMGRLLDLIPPDGPPERYGNVVMRTGERERSLPPAVFPHWLHRARYNCTVCHSDLGFSMSRGETSITREDYLAGRYCGACHDGTTAFTAEDQEPRYCDRCHLKDQGALDAQFRKFSSALPESGYGNKIDWVRALEKGLIAPKKTLQSDSPPLALPKNLERPLALKGTSFTETFFPHQQHLAWIDCSGCHPEIFNIQKKGTVHFSMEKNLYGWFCGTCHLRVSFSMFSCKQCHPKMRNWR